MSADLFEPDGFQLTPPPAPQSSAATQAGKARRGRAKATPEQQSTEEWLRDYDGSAFTSEEQYELAQRFYAAPIAAEGHPYAQRKGISVQHDGSPVPLRLQGQELLLPVQDTAGAIQGVQRITPKGDKLQWRGSTMTGSFHLIGARLEQAQCILVAEGLATGASAHEATGLPVAVACGAGNLCEAAKAIRNARPALPIIIAADDDWHGRATLAGAADADGVNVGMKAARTAALAVGGKLAVPVFPAGYARRDTETDFNDLAQLPDGAALVRQCIEAAQLVTGDAGASASSGSSAGEEWEEPQPLPDKLCPVEPFHEAMLPPVLRAWVMDVAERAECPPDFTAAGAMSALSSLLGGRLRVQPKLRDDYSIAPNFWTVAIGIPGLQKSFCMGEAVQMLKRLKRDEMSRSKDARLVWAAQAKRARLAIEEAEKQAKKLVAAGDTVGADALIADAMREEQAIKDMEPHERGYIYSDATVQAYQEAMLKDPWGGMLYRDELVGTLKSFEMQGQETARSFYMEAWSGYWEYDMLRVVRGKRHVPFVITTFAGTTQPSVWLPYVRSASKGGDGLVQRFLPIWKDYAYTEDVDRNPDEAAWQQAFRLYEYFASLPAPALITQPDGSTAYDVPKRRFSPAADEIYKAWRQSMKQSLPALIEEWGEGYGGHVAKMQSTLPTAALIFAVARNFEQGARPEEGEVEEVDVRRALVWEPYLLSHMQRTYAAANASDMDAARKLLSMIQAGKLTAPNSHTPMASFRASDVARKEWAGLKAADDVYRAADKLTLYGWLRCEEGQRGASGRPSERRYRVHPCLPGGAQ